MYRLVVVEGKTAEPVATFPHESMDFDVVLSSAKQLARKLVGVASVRIEQVKP